MQYTPEQVQVGKDNFHEAVAYTRRSVLKGGLAVGVTAGATVFGYKSLEGERVRVGFIGTGDEGGVLMTEHPKDYMQIVAVADLRPANLERAFKGDGNDVRAGLNKILGNDEAAKVQKFSNHKEMIAAKDELGLEAVIIAVPLSQHAPIAKEALDAGLHVLSEKLMANSIPACKEIIQIAKQKDLLLAVGHQRHYSVLYDNANELVKTGLLGELKYIRAQWHRNNSFPGSDQWRKEKKIKEEKDSLADVPLQDFGYENVDQLINWRLYNETGGGLMAELGSHQMDAASIFLGKVHPLAVSGYGGKNYYGIHGVGPEDKWDDDREIDDQIYVTFEFPGPKYDANDEQKKRDICIVTYSSINTNRLEPYGELVYGSRGTLIMKTEKEALLYKEEGRGSTGGGPDQRLWVVENSSGGGPALDAYETTAPTAAASASQIEDVSRGYKEEMEHFAYCIRNNRPVEELRCNGTVAMADAIMALTANMAMKYKRRIEFKPEWFDPANPANPEEDVAKLIEKFPLGSWDQVS